MSFAFIFALTMALGLGFDLGMDLIVTLTAGLTFMNMLLTTSQVFFFVGAIAYYLDEQKKAQKA